MVRIHGKEYAEVKDRIKLFRAQYPDWSITTECIAKAEDMSWVLFQAIIISPDEKQAFTGWAFERESNKPDEVNFTSHVENCETSAVGRALANMDFAASENRPSAEEMQKVDRTKAARLEPTATSNPLAAKLKNPEPKKPGRAERVEAYVKAIKAMVGHDQPWMQALLNHKVEAPSDLNHKDWADLEEGLTQWLNNLGEWLFAETKVTGATYKDLQTDDQKARFESFWKKTVLLV